MAKSSGSSSSGINKLATSIKDSIGKLYGSTYFSQPTNSRDLANIKKDISTSINNINNNNMDTAGVANISKLYSRINSVSNDSGTSRRLEEIFSDKANMDDIMQSYLENKYLKDLDNEIDTVCKYMPKLLEALDTRKDNVLSADHFSKDFISIVNNTTINNTTFSERIESIKDKYDILNEADIWYDNASKYGEQFVYVVPYTKAIEKIRSTQTIGVARSVVSESAISDFETGSSIGVLDTISEHHFNLEINNSGMLIDTIKQMNIASNKLDSISEQSLCLEYSHYLQEQAIKEGKNIDKLIDLSKIPGKGKDEEEETLSKTKPLQGNNLDSRILNNMPQDGLIGNKNDKANKLNIPGCIVKALDRTLISPIYIESICMGYYYIETRNGEEANFNSNGSIMDPTLNNNRARAYKNPAEMNKQDVMLRTMASQMSSYIDTKFINNNIDISKEIYMILKYNDLYNKPDATMRITYIPPEDIVHIKFKEDPITHRGISDLERALFPAKLYSCLYITNTIALMTRSYDKRVYYVKQTIENNIAKTLLTTINQIKKSNFGLRQIENINNILNITGTFNDFLIPTNSSNDPPIDFQIMQGQQINTPTELLDTLQEVAINSTDVPIELINARQSMDYAVQYTMTNSKFLRKVYSRQGKYQVFLSDILSKIYSYEYMEDSKLKVTLPPPVFLNITNTSQIINNVNDFSNAIVEIKMAAEPNEKVKAIFAKNVKEFYLGSYLDSSILDKLEDDARQSATIKDPPPEEG